LLGEPVVLQGLQPSDAQCPVEIARHLAGLRTFIADETEKWAKVIKFANIKPK
jgi:hypothetical protein